MSISFRGLSAILCLYLLFTGCGNNGSSGNKADDTLTVMTYNIHHANPPESGDRIIDLGNIARAINKVQPDLVALQEIDVHTQRSGKDLDEARKLAQLTGMQSYFTQTLDYEGGQYGIAVLSRFPPEDSAGYLLPVAAGAREEVRGLCMIKVTLPDKNPLYFASTHLGLSRETRLLQTDSILKVLQHIPAPFIIGGDFNAAPGSETIDRFSAFLKRSCTSGCAPTIPYDDPRKKIDFIFYKSGNVLKPIDQEVLAEFKGSDHLPVVVHFKVK